MKRVLIIVIMAMLMATSTTFASTESDYNLAMEYVNNNCPNATVYEVKTKSKGGYKGKEIGTRYTVRYPKKVKKGKKVTVYMVCDNDGNVVAMVCLGKVKE